MNTIVLALVILTGGLAVASVCWLIALSMRALRRGADFQAEMRAPSFAFKVRVRPPRPDDE
ncbi:MAG TPA: hypothetical protein VFG31_05460 [Conexibacter sp.]|nr:hypothetical protein [Conexibacter sp.]